ncbi:MAG: alpha/beta hydrolase [Euryarchaeota archaeon]|nr:alpha/beta hydrolase [Euryarchaeota archaeon]
MLVEGGDHGRPTVILESGFGGTIDAWSEVRQALSGRTRVVSYHRAGMSGSQPGPRPRSADRIVHELRIALRHLDIQPPYLLVGHSLGGLYVRAFAGIHGDDVVGLVLVDPTMEFEQAFTNEQVTSRLRDHWGQRYPRVERALNRSHPRMRSLAAQSMLGLEPYLEQLPGDQVAAARETWLNAFTKRNRQINGMLALMSKVNRLEMFASLESMEVVRRQPRLDIPVTLLVAGKSNTSNGPDFGDPNTNAAYHAWARTSRLSRYRKWIETNPQGKLTVLQQAGHNIPREQPQAIVDAVLEMIQ